MSDVFDDIAWAWRMLQVRRIRRKLIFSARKIYDDGLRPSVGSEIIAYPDAIYYVQHRDLLRAAFYVERKAYSVPSTQSQGEAQ